jgi:hypothetical protein
MPVEGYKSVSLPTRLVERIENVRKKQGLRSWREAVEYLIEKSEPEKAFIGLATRDLAEQALFFGESSA